MESNVILPPDYKPTADEKYMNEMQLEYFRQKLLDWKKSLIGQSTDTLNDLKEGKPVDQPVYSYVTCERSKIETVKVNPAHIIIIEGILVFTCEKLREMMDIKVFVDADADDRLSRVIARDIVERGKNVDQVLRRYEYTVKPMHLQFIEPTKRYADIIVPQGGHNQVAIDMLLAIIEKALKHNNSRAEEV